MMVYNDISRDARVIRAAKALKADYELTLYAVGELDEPAISFVPVKNCKKIGGAVAQLKFVVGAIGSCLKRRPDIIYAHDIFSAVPMVLLRWLGLHAKYIYDAHELFLAEEHPNCGTIEKLQYWFEAEAIKSADLVICAQRERAKIMAGRHGMSEEPVVIRNISYLQKSSEKKIPNEYAAFWDIPAFSVVYAGGFLKGRRLDCLISAIVQLGKGYKLMLVGDGPDYERLQGLLDKCGTENVVIRHSVPYAELGELLACFDAGYLFYPNDTLNNRYCAPNKIFEYAGIGLPIIANENLTVEEELVSYDIGVCENDICKAIRQVEKRKIEIKRNMQRYTEDNSLESEMEKLRLAVRGLFIK